MQYVHTSPNLKHINGGDVTSHGGDDKGRMVLNDGELKLKVYRDVTLQSEGLVACATNWGGRELNMAGKLGCVHHWVGMNGNQQVLIILWR